MASAVDICNEALAILGNDPIVSMEDRDVKAIRCKQFYTITRNAVLRAHPWNFATRRVQLQRAAAVPTFGFSYGYKMPPFCLRLLVAAPTGADVDSPNIHDDGSSYRVEGDVILSNEETLFAKYIIEIEEPGLFDALFTEAFAAKLAMKLAVALTGAASKLELAAKLFQLALKSATGVDAVEAGTPAQSGSCGWLRARN